jgi:hypothetical protein
VNDEGESGRKKRGLSAWEGVSKFSTREARGLLRLFERMSQKSILVAACLVASAIGCQSTAVSPGERGFGYVCTDGPSDAACNELPGLPAAHADVALPEKLAVGSTFRAGFWLAQRGSADGPVPVIGESPGVLSPVLGAPGSFRVERPGSIALVALGPTDEVVGRARLSASPIDHVGFDRYEAATSQPSGDQGVSKITIERIGARAVVRGVPMDAEGAVLGGALPCTWSSSNPGVVAIEGSPKGNVIEVSAIGSGSTTLHVELGAARADLPVVVPR